MQFRGTMNFVDRDGQGWSESYWLSQGDHTQAATALLVIIPLRLAMLTSDIHMVHAEVSVTDHQRDSRVVGLTGPTENPGTYTPAAGTVPLATQVAVLWEFEGDPAHKNRKFLHGWTSADVDGNRFVPSAAMQTIYAAFNAALLSQAFQVRVNRHANPVPPPNFTYDYIPITVIRQIRVVTRRIGRPFGLPVGRRRAH
jgi:hypothetical protein